MFLAVHTVTASLR